MPTSHLDLQASKRAERLGNWMQAQPGGAGWRSKAVDTIEAALRVLNDPTTNVPMDKTWEMFNEIGRPRAV